MRRRRSRLVARRKPNPQHCSDRGDGRPDDEHRAPADRPRDVGRERGAEDVAHQEAVAIQVAGSRDRRGEPPPYQDRERGLRERDRKGQQRAARENPEHSGRQRDRDGEDDEPGAAKRDEAPCAVSRGEQSAGDRRDAHREHSERRDGAGRREAQPQVGANRRQRRRNREEDHAQVEGREPDEPEGDDGPAHARGQIFDESGTGLWARTHRNTSLVAS